MEPEVEAASKSPVTATAPSRTPPAPFSDSEEARTASAVTVPLAEVKSASVAMTLVIVTDAPPVDGLPFEASMSPSDIVRLVPASKSKFWIEKSSIRIEPLVASRSVAPLATVKS